MTYAVIQLTGENINIEIICLSESQCINHIKHLTYLNIDNVKRIIQGVIHSTDDISMDGYYIEETIDPCFFNIIQRNTNIVPGWIANSIDLICQKLGSLQIKYLAQQSQQHQQQQYFDKPKIDNKYFVVNSPEPNKIQQFAPAVISEFMQKIKEKKLNKLE